MGGGGCHAQEGEEELRERVPFDTIWSGFFFQERGGGARGEEGLRESVSGCVWVSVSVCLGVGVFEHDTPHTVCLVVSLFRFSLSMSLSLSLFLSLSLLLALLPTSVSVAVDATVSVSVSVSAVTTSFTTSLCVCCDCLCTLCFVYFCLCVRALRLRLVVTLVVKPVVQHAT